METPDQQKSPTGKQDVKSSERIKMIADIPTYDEDYLNELIAKASKTWKGIDAEVWLDEIRGNYDE